MRLKDIKMHIDECKFFWKVTDFEKEILNWEFKINHPSDLVFNIGHPRGSHKGDSIGDIIPYTRLPELIKEKYSASTVTVPSTFVPIFKNNPFVDSFNGSPSKWGSLGTFGTTVQRTCNVWGFQTFETTPKIYIDGKKTRSDAILFCINSKTGGRIKNIKLIEEIIEQLKEKYYCVQLGLKSDGVVRSANEYIFNADNTNLVNIVSQFDYYIGSQNSIYHLSKGLGLNLIGILPENVIPDLVILPFLTQINHLETEMLSSDQTKRCNRWKQWIKSKNIDPNESHHIGWLYPDSCHLTERSKGTYRCPPLSIDNIERALKNEIYPYGEERLWKMDKYRSLWIGDS